MAIEGAAQTETNEDPGLTKAEVIVSTVQLAVTICLEASYSPLTREEELRRSKRS